MDRNDLIGYKTKILNMDALIAYVLVNNKLVRGNIVFKEKTLKQE